MFSCRSTNCSIWSSKISRLGKPGCQAQSNAWMVFGAGSRTARGRLARWVSSRAVTSSVTTILRHLGRRLYGHRAQLLPFCLPRVPWRGLRGAVGLAVHAVTPGQGFLVKRSLYAQGGPVLDVPVHVADRGLALAVGLRVLPPHAGGRKPYARAKANKSG